MKGLAETLLVTLSLGLLTILGKNTVGVENTLIAYHLIACFFIGCYFGNKKS